jgi:FtsZ-binding cell division protein ZapB
MNTEIEVFPTVINDDTVNTITIPDQNTIESTDNIEALKQEIEELKTKNGRLEQRVEQLETENGNLKAENDLLHTAYNGTIEQLNNTHDQINMAHATVEQKLNPNVMVDQSAYVKTNDSMMKSDPSMHK